MKYLIKNILIIVAPMLALLACDFLNSKNERECEALKKGCDYSSIVISSSSSSSLIPGRLPRQCAECQRCDSDNLEIPVPTECYNYAEFYGCEECIDDPSPIPGRLPPECEYGGVCGSGLGIPTECYDYAEFIEYGCIDDPQSSSSSLIYGSLPPQCEYCGGCNE